MPAIEVYPSIPLHVQDPAADKHQSNLRRLRPASNISKALEPNQRPIEEKVQTRNNKIVSNLWLRSYLSPDHKTDQESRGFMFTCNNIDQIAIKRKLGQGVTKQVYLGQYGGSKVAVKMITRNVIDVKSCLFKLKRNVIGIDESELPKETQRCYTLPNMKLMKEILLLHQLKHPNMLKLLGYCARSEETESTSLQDHGVIAVYEHALPFYPSTLSTWPWYLRVKTAFELTDLLYYLQHSPLGSLRISDFKEIHFLLKDGRIKLTDLDDVTSLEPKCDINQNQHMGNADSTLLFNQGANNQNNHGAKDNDLTQTCGYNLKCIGGICQGFNALHNIAHMNKHYFQNLLYGDCEDHEEMCSKLRTRLNNLDISAGRLKELLYQMMRVPYLPGYT